MPRDEERFGEPHTLTAYYEYDGADELTYDLEHSPSCQQAERYGGRVLEYTCDIGWHEEQVGLLEALSSSGTPVTEPGTYRIQGWSRKTWYYGAGYEHDAGVGVMEPEAVTA